MPCTVKTTAAKTPPCEMVETWTTKMERKIRDAFDRGDCIDELLREIDEAGCNVEFYKRASEEYHHIWITPREVTVIDGKVVR